MIQKNDKIVITGAAGLVGQNLVLLLRESGYTNLTAIDRRARNLRILSDLNPGLTVIEADLAETGGWMDAFKDASILVQLHAQIGGEIYEQFVANNIRATENVVAACHRHGVRHIVHVSSSVVNSKVTDYYTETKKAQEALVQASGIPFISLRPTLMFGWFDRKHLGWLARFMKKSPLFPVPGSGRYLRQPLYVRDFCSVIVACLARAPDNKTYNITGAETVDYIDIVRSIKRVTKARAVILKVPYVLFWTLLRIYGSVNRNPPFTTRQLKALATPDRFELVPWWDIFGVQSTAFDKAIAETFGDARFADIALEF